MFEDVLNTPLVVITFPNNPTVGRKNKQMTGKMLFGK